MHNTALISARSSLLQTLLIMLPWPVAFAFFARDLVSYDFELYYFFVSVPALIYFEFSGEKCAPVVGMIIWATLALIPAGISLRQSKRVARPVYGLLALYACINGIFGVFVLSR